MYHAKNTLKPKKGAVFLFDWLSVRPGLVIGYRSMEHGAVKV